MLHTEEALSPSPVETRAPRRKARRLTQRVALTLGAALLVGTAVTAAPEPAHAASGDLMPTCSNRNAVQTKYGVLTMMVWFYNKDRKKFPASGGAAYRWSYTGNMSTYDVGLKQWIAAGSTKYTCTGS
ncbi:hypothetical protein [Curtobacterium caseinilyticum]|uniref:Ig-like domain-containing protein n=1 Tax=Curtobacterium caseinilyticum TaxID=3055137 RepID=A0ABT7TS38_9MICO|nr:hypothetical protein [Curtobacterium caseinilyticum]MDM7892320.1 hypothetical protein [Curtobacterium caseinilyticum]